MARAWLPGVVSCSCTPSNDLSQRPREDMTSQWLLLAAVSAHKRLVNGSGAAQTEVQDLLAACIACCI